MEKIIYETTDAKPRNDAYTSMLFVTMLCMLIGIVLVAVECDEYSWESDIKPYDPLKLPTITFTSFSDGSGETKPPAKEDKNPKEAPKGDASPPETPKDEKPPKEVKPAEPKAEAPERPESPAITEKREPRPGLRLPAPAGLVTPALADSSTDEKPADVKQAKKKPAAKVKKKAPNADEPANTPVKVAPPITVVPNQYSLPLTPASSNSQNPTPPSTTGQAPYSLQPLPPVAPESPTTPQTTPNRTPQIIRPVVIPGPKR